MNTVLDEEEQSDDVFSVTVSGDGAGMRLDAFIASVSFDSESVSRSYAQTLIEDGMVSVDGKVVAVKKHKLSEGSVVQLILPEPKTIEAVPQNIPIDIVYEDADVLVVNKPRGMVVHPARGNYDGTLVNAVMYHCADSLSDINGQIRPGIVHRIDKDTSGLLMIAKNNHAHESLARQLELHTVTREYTAVVCDNIKEDELTIDAPIGRDEKNRLKRAVYGSNAKHAVTHIRVVERFGRYTLIKARLETGRTHQIRVHLAYKKHPLLGDVMYGSRNQPFGLQGQLLHAGLLGFVHPETGEYMEFSAPLPDYFSSVLDKLRGSFGSTHTVVL